MSLEVVITSGGTISEIDDVRHIGNFSSGTTGALIAEEFLKKGHKVFYVYSKNSEIPFHRQFKLDPNKEIETELIRLKKVYTEFQDYKNNLIKVPILTFEDYYNNLKHLLQTKKIDVAVLAAAVSDYTVEKQDGKISSDLDDLSIKLKRNPKIISLVKQWNPEVYQVGFKLLVNVSDDELLRVGYEHMHKNNSDLVVANSLNRSDFMNSSTYILSKDNTLNVKRYELAEKLVDKVIHSIP